MHELGWLEIIGEYEGRELGTLEVSIDRKEDGGVLVGFIYVSLDGTEE